jgi:hypothetical protein
MSESESTVDNGVNVEHLVGAREALTEAPEAAQFNFSASAKSRHARPPLPLTPTTRRSSHRRISAPRPSSTCWWDWPAA